jgi:hypothetical protein
MLDPKNVLLGALAYLREHPQEILRAAKMARHLRFGLPIAALRWLVAQLEQPGGPEDVEIDAVPPGLRVAATVREMETPLRVSAVAFVERVRASADELRVEVRLNDVSIRVLDAQIRTPLAALIRSGVLDLSRMADLVAQMPARPDILVDAVDNRLVLDFMRSPRLSGDEHLRKTVGAISSLLSVEAVETDPAHVDIGIKALPAGFTALFSPR